MGRILAARLKEHSDEVDNISKNKRYTRSSVSQASYERHKSAITDHAIQRNHVIDFDSVSILNREDNRKLRCIKESIEIRCHSDNMNRDQGGHLLDHCYDDVLALNGKVCKN